MVLCEYYYDPGSEQVMEGLGLIGGICVLPHHDTFGQKWSKRLRGLLPNTVLLGIDEETGIFCNESAGHGRVEGKGQVTLYHNGLIDTIGPGQKANLSFLTWQRLP